MPFHPRINSRKAMHPDVTPEYARAIIARFLDCEWSLTKDTDVVVERITEGMVNTVHIVHRRNQAVVEPATVILRHYGGNKFDLSSWSIKNSEVEESAIVKEMSDRGFGPKLYGLFDGGRVEEFIVSRTLSHDDLNNKDICADIARSYARVHSLQPPIRRDKFDCFFQSVNMISDASRVLLVTGVTRERPDLLPILCKMLDVDTTSEKKWLIKMMKETRMKKSLTMFDTNMSNILIRTDYDADKHNSRVLLIDYEGASYAYSGIDLGGHFNMRMVQITDGVPRPSAVAFAGVDVIRSFIEVYADECRVLGTVRTSDTIDSLVRQTLLGSMISTMFFIETIFANPLIITAQVPCLECFGQFVDVYYETKKQLEIRGQ